MRTNKIICQAIILYQYTFNSLLVMNYLIYENVISLRFNHVIHGII